MREFGALASTLIQLPRQRFGAQLTGEVVDVFDDLAVDRRQTIEPVCAWNRQGAIDDALHRRNGELRFYTTKLGIVDYAELVRRTFAHDGGAETYALGVDLWRSSARVIS